MEATLRKVTSPEHFGAIQHEMIGTCLTCVLDMLPLESRMNVTSNMGKRQKEESKYLKI